MTVAVVTEAAPLRAALAPARTRQKRIGLVPTMGALHRGHLALVELARKQTDFVVVSIFVNPIQFGPKEDLAKYPRPLEEDLELCTKAGVDLVFHPTPAVIYPPGFATFVEVTGLQDVLCGASRPGHFRGVATVVLKLFNLVQPDYAFFGQKDAQQVCVLKQMVRDLDVPVEMIVGATVREPDGLALSSRNRFLTTEQRGRATILYQALLAARALIEKGERDPGAIRRTMIEQIAATPGAMLDYAAVVDAATLQTPSQLAGQTLMALAVKFGETRLIDNLLVDVKGFDRPR